MSEVLISEAEKNVRNIITLAIEHNIEARALVVYDEQFGLTEIITKAYRRVLPEAQFLNFDTTDKSEIILAFDALRPGDLVVLIQSGSFRLNEFRIRIHLFKLGLKVVEHMHLYRNSEDTWPIYINALAYDPNWFRSVGAKIKGVLDAASSLTISSMGQKLVVNGALEEARLNVGDYREMENVGGTYPIGEVFTEAKNFSDMNGSIMIYALAGDDFIIQMYDPFRIDIKDGEVVAWAENTPQVFVDKITAIKLLERALVREIGFGLNKAITKEHFMQDITAFERILGLHLSLGEKHSVYKKEGIQTHKARFHVDVFPVVGSVSTDKVTVFENGEYV